MIWLIAYVAVGVILFGVFWKIFDIRWSAEAADMKIVMVGTPLAWPLVLLYILCVWMGVFGK